MKYLTLALIVLFSQNVYAAAAVSPLTTEESAKSSSATPPVLPIRKAEYKPASEDQEAKEDMIEAEAKNEKSEIKKITFIPDEDSINKEPLPYVGTEEVVETIYEDTLQELGRKYNVGYVELIAANPDVDPLLPGEGTKVVIPQRHLLPDAPREGIVINLAEMRLYSYVKDTNNPISHPIGIGRDGLHTPLGVTKIVRKAVGPTWRPTERMRRENPKLPAAVGPGEDNPLGTHALYLGWPQYLIHGTHKPLGVGRRVSSGCIRMYPEDIIQIFRDVPTGTQVNVVKQPIKMAWIDGMLYLEAHAEDELADTFEAKGKLKEYRVPETLFADLKDISGDHYDRLDWEKIRETVKSRNGRPTPILLESKSDMEVTEDILNPVQEPEQTDTPDAKAKKSVIIRPVNS